MTLTIYPRAVWGPRRPNGDRTLYGPARGVYVHHSASAAPAHNLDAEVRAMRALEATGYHRFGPGQGISYNFPIMPSGRVFEGVSVNRRGAHTGGLNTVVRSIVFVGNYEDAHPTAAQLESAAELLAHGKRAGWWSGLILGGHRDVKGTACPGRHVYARIGDINARAAALLGGPVAPVNRPVVPDLDDDLDPTVGDLPAPLTPTTPLPEDDPMTARIAYNGGHYLVNLGTGLFKALTALEQTIALTTTNAAAPVVEVDRRTFDVVRQQVAECGERVHPGHRARFDDHGITYVPVSA